MVAASSSSRRGAVTTLVDVTFLVIMSAEAVRRLVKTSVSDDVVDGANVVETVVDVDVVVVVVDVVVVDDVTASITTVGLNVVGVKFCLLL